MNCNNCGQSLKEGAKFCKECGTPVVMATAPGDYPVFKVALPPVAPPSFQTADSETWQPPPKPIDRPTAYKKKNSGMSSKTIALIAVSVFVLICVAAGIVYLQKKNKSNNSLVPQQSPPQTSQYPEKNATDPSRTAVSVTKSSAALAQSNSAFYTAVLGNYSTEKDAQIGMEKLRAKGIPQLDYLYSSEWENLRPGWWVVFSEKLPDMNAATQKAEEFKSKGCESYPRFTGSRKIPANALLINLTTFSSFPNFIVGCSSLYSESRDKYMAKKYLYADDLGQQDCLISIDNRPVRLKYVGGSSDESYFSEYSNGEYSAFIRVKKSVDSGREGEYIDGELTVKHKDGSTITKTIYGERGC